MWVPGGQSWASFLVYAKVTWGPLISCLVRAGKVVGALYSFFRRASRLQELQGQWVPISAHVCLPQRGGAGTAVGSVGTGSFMTQTVLSLLKGSRGLYQMGGGKSFLFPEGLQSGSHPTP